MHGEQLPLMNDWSDALCEALDETERSLAQAIHLRPGLSGPEFESALGLVIQWRRVMYLAQHFAGLGWQNAGEIVEHHNTIHANQERRLTRIVEVINKTLYAKFGHQSVSDAAAEDAYGELLEKFGSDLQLVVATTNYDLSVESGLDRLGHDVRNGFESARGRTPVLAPDGVVDLKGVTPVLHLHGAVGWYEKDGYIYEHPGDQPFNPTLGTPVVLYPDPHKDPASDPNVASLWAEFHKAVDAADRILVLGHSLSDPVLVGSLTNAPAATAVTVWAPPNADIAATPAQSTSVRELLPDAHVIGTRFGPRPEFDRPALKKFVT